MNRGMKWMVAGWIGMLAGAAFAADNDPTRYGDQNEAKGFSEGNPIVPGLFADPSVAKFGDTYYLYATTDGFGWPTGRWVVWKSKDFVHWSFKGESFPEITGRQNWAPGVPVHRNGRYWLPYTLHGGEGRIAVADKPEGPFRDAFGKVIVKDIDSEFFIDDDGTPYFVWGRPVPSINRLKPDFSAVEEPTAHVDFRKGYVEGPFMFKRNGIYYMCGANLGYAEYRIIYGMGDKPTGPFRFPEDNFIVQPNPADHLWGTGHGNVVRVNDRDDWVVVYLRSRMGERVDPFMEGGNVYRQVCADRISFNADGTIKRHGPTRKGVGVLGISTERGVNIALGKTATASSSLQRYGPGKAVDGGFGTRWIVGDGEAIVSTSETRPMRWRWTTTRPADDWMKPGFDAAAWQEGKGGFGTPDTPGAVLGTTWDTADIWLRRYFTLTAADLKRALRFRLHHDDDIEVYLNGVLAVKLGGFTLTFIRIFFDMLLVSIPASSTQLSPLRNGCEQACWRQRKLTFCGGLGRTDTSPRPIARR